jgi:cysteinyl-tRNA synthetase
MTIRLHNTPSGKVEEFKPIADKQALIYTCGPTVYNYAHIGNWASYIYWDTLVRILIANGYEIKRVMNITDVGHLTSDADEGEDKLEQGARREGKTAWDIAKFYTDDFIKWMGELNMVEPQHLAKATDYITDQINLVRKLKEKGYTYQIDDGIYFDTSKFPKYAKFAHLNLDAQKAGARVEANPAKKNPNDFALWKFTPTNTKRDMQWPTPPDLLEENANSQPMGFPGWHIECSAIVLALLGETIDIHTGGIDHIPVHHTNEIAQSEAVTGKKLSNYWLHCEFLKVNGTKISKSLGNIITLDDIVRKGYSPLDFRMFILQGSYRNSGNFTYEGLSAAKKRLTNWRNVAALRHQTNDTIESDEERSHDNKIIPAFSAPQAVIETLSDDLNTPQALKIIDDVFSDIQGADLDNINQQSLVQLLETVDQTLGLKLIDSTPDISDEAKRLIVERNASRENKDWKMADLLREKLLEMNIALRDTYGGTAWEYPS